MAAIRRTPHTRDPALLLCALAVLASAASASADAAEAGEARPAAPAGHLRKTFLATLDQRRLQEQADYTRVANCPEGYVDVTDGRAYFWVCGRGCVGGPYVTPDCDCACQTPKQIAAPTDGPSTTTWDGRFTHPPTTTTFEPPPTTTTPPSARQSAYDRAMAAMAMGKGPSPSDGPGHPPPEPVAVEQSEGMKPEYIVIIASCSLVGIICTVSGVLALVCYSPGKLSRIAPEETVVTPPVVEVVIASTIDGHPVKLQDNLSEAGSNLPSIMSSALSQHSHQEHSNRPSHASDRSLAHSAQHSHAGSRASSRPPSVEPSLRGRESNLSKRSRTPPMSRPHSHEPMRMSQRSANSLRVSQNQVPRSVSPAPSQGSVGSHRSAQPKLSQGPHAAEDGHLAVDAAQHSAVRAAGRTSYQAPFPSAVGPQRSSRLSAASAQAEAASRSPRAASRDRSS